MLQTLSRTEAELVAHGDFYDFLSKEFPDVCHRIEEIDCRVMNLMIRPDEKTGIWKACLRIDREDAAPVLRSLERFDYRVVSCYQLHGVMDERIEQRIKELMYYLEM